jgi:hypothetical protein
VRESKENLVCHLLGGKITYIHRRLWPALVRLSEGLDRKDLAALHEEHTESGGHRLRTIAFPRWVPAAGPVIHSTGNVGISSSW